MSKMDEILMNAQGVTPSIDSANAWDMRKQAKAAIKALIAAEVIGTDVSTDYQREVAQSPEDMIINTEKAAARERLGGL